MKESGEGRIVELKFAIRSTMFQEDDEQAMATKKKLYLKAGSEIKAY